MTSRNVGESSASEPSATSKTPSAAPLTAAERRNGVRLVGSQSGLPSGHIRFAAVSKYFRKSTLQVKSYQTLKTGLLTGLRKLFGLQREKFSDDDFSSADPGTTPDRSRHGLHVALSYFSLDIEPGTALGIIGRNGSGKSTLLKLIAGIYHPDRGRVAVSGRISALIELGAGFHPDFTGRENIFLGGIMYGLKRGEIESLFEKIVSFAELEDVIDDPVRTYSSGMYMRLGFSLAVHTNPDILLIDEVLAVGDAAFVSRCHDVISDFKRRGKTIILVSHDMSAMTRWCDEVIWLQQGRVVSRGEPKVIVDHYLLEVERKHEQDLASFNLESDEKSQRDVRDESGGREGDGVEPGESFVERDRWGSREVTLDAIRLSSTTESRAHWVFHTEDSLTVEVDFSIHVPIDDLVFGIGIIRADGTLVHGCNTDIDGFALSDQLVRSPQGGFAPQQGVYRYQISRLGLPEDTYFLDIAAHRADGAPFDYHHLKHKFAVRADRPYPGTYVPEHAWSVEPHIGRLETGDLMANDPRWAVGEG